MAAGVRNIKIRFLGDTKGLDRASKDGQKSLDGWKGTLEKWNKRAVAASTAVIGGALAVGKNLVSVASDAQQSLGAVESVFGQFADGVVRKSKGAAAAVGLSANAYRELASVTGAQLKNMGVPMDEVAGKTDSLIGLGADLAATFGGPTSDAVAAIGSLLRGEADPIERYGVSIKEADINARLAAMGLDGLEGEAAKTARTQALLSLLTEQTADAQGQFSRESNTAAGQAQRAQAKWENLRAELGMKLLPLYTSLAALLSGTLLPFMSRHQGAIAATAAVIVGLAGAVLAINAVWKTYEAVTKAVRLAQLALNLAMMMNPIGLVVLAIIALIAILVLAWQKSETFRRIVTGVFNAVRDAAIKAKDWIVDKWNALVDFVVKLPGRISRAARGMWDGIKSAFRSAVNWLIDKWNGLSFTLGGGSILGINIPSITLSTPNIPRLATGGRAMPGRAYLVGERGRELFVPDQAGEVVPNHEFGGDTIVHVYIDGRALDDSVLRVVSNRDRGLRRRALAGVGARA